MTGYPGGSHRISRVIISSRDEFQTSPAPPRRALAWPVGRGSYGLPLRVPVVVLKLIPLLSALRRSDVHAWTMPCIGKERETDALRRGNDGDDILPIPAIPRTNKGKQGIPTLLPPTRGQTNSARYARNK